MSAIAYGPIGLVFGKDGDRSLYAWIKCELEAKRPLIIRTVRKPMQLESGATFGIWLDRARKVIVLEISPVMDTHVATEIALELTQCMGQDWMCEVHEGEEKE